LQAQYNTPWPDPPIPGYAVQKACEFLADPNLKELELLDAMLQALDVFLGNASSAIVGCLDTLGSLYGSSAEDNDAWGYQVRSINHMSTLGASA